MHLGVARLCLDCEEVHEGDHCPACGSESFTFLARWVKVSTRPGPQEAARPPRQAAPAERAEQVEAYRQLLDGERRRVAASRMVARGAFGLAMVGLARLAWRAVTPEPEQAETGENEQKPRQPG
jgi:hypothetical protein